MPKDLIVDIKFIFQWEDEDRECGINAGYVLTDITSKDGKEISLSHRTMEELTEVLTK
jgi:hypothetical protein